MMYWYNIQSFFSVLKEGENEWGRVLVGAQEAGEVFRGLSWLDEHLTPRT